MTNQKKKDFMKHGVWIKAYHKNIWGDRTLVFECSVCGKYTVDKKGITTKSRYCPNCGTSMWEE